MKKGSRAPGVNFRLMFGAQQFVHFVSKMVFLTKGWKQVGHIVANNNYALYIN